MIEFKNIRKILVLKFRHIGDVLLIVPTIRALKETFPGASVSVAINAGTEDVLAGHPLIDELIIFDRTVPGIIKIMGIGLWNKIQTTK